MSARRSKARDIEGIAMSSVRADPATRYARPRLRCARGAIVERGAAIARRTIGVGRWSVPRRRRSAPHRRFRNVRHRECQWAKTYVNRLLEIDAYTAISSMTI